MEPRKIVSLVKFQTAILYGYQEITFVKKRFFNKAIY